MILSEETLETECPESLTEDSRVEWPAESVRRAQ